MAKTPSHVSAFGRDSLRDLFERVSYAYNKYKTDVLNFREAEIFSVVMHHFFKDWLQHHINQSDYNDAKDDADKVIKIEREIMRDIADGYKHVKLTLQHKQLKDQSEYKGAFSSGFDRGFNTSALVLTLQNGQELYFEDIADTIYNYWEQYLKSKGLI